MFCKKNDCHAILAVANAGFKFLKTFRKVTKLVLYRNTT